MDLCTHYATMHEYINNNIMRNCMKYDYEVLFEEGWLDNIGKSVSDFWNTSSKWVSSNWKNILKAIVRLFQAAVNWVLNKFSSTRDTLHKASRGAVVYIKKLCNKAYEKINRYYKNNSETLDGNPENKANQDNLCFWYNLLNMFEGATGEGENKTYKKVDARGKDKPDAKLAIISINKIYNKIFSEVQPNFEIDSETSFPLYTKTNNGVVTATTFKEIIRPEQFKTWLTDVKDYYEDYIFVNDVSFYNNLAALRTNVAKQLHYIDQFFKLIKKIDEISASDYKKSSAEEKAAASTEEKKEEEKKEEEKKEEEKKEKVKASESTVFDCPDYYQLFSEANDEKRILGTEAYKDELDKALQALYSKIDKEEDQLTKKIQKELNSSAFKSVSSANCLKIINVYLNEKTNLFKEKIAETASTIKEYKKGAWEFTVDNFKETEIKKDLKETANEYGSEPEWLKNIKKNTPDTTSMSKIVNGANITDIMTQVQNAAQIYNDFERFFVAGFWYFEQKWRIFEEK